MFRFLAIFAVFFLIFSNSSSACSVDRSYTVPANFDLVKMADAIVLARPKRQNISGDERILFKVTQNISGNAVPSEVSGFGNLVNSSSAQRSDPNELSSAHPETYSGSCVRYSIPKDATFLLFLQKTTKGWEIISFPFARTFEDVADANSLWVWVITQYAQVAAIKHAPNQYSALVRLRDLPPNAPEDWKERLIEDINTYLSSRNPRKSLSFIEAQLADDNATPYEKAGALSSLLTGRDEDISQYFQGFEHTNMPLPLIGAFAEYYEQSNNPKSFIDLVNGRLADIVNFGGLIVQNQVENTFTVLLNDLPIEFIVEGYWAFRNSNHRYQLRYEDLGERLREYAHIRPVDSPALAIMQATYNIPEPIEWAKQAINENKQQYSKLAVRIIAEVSDGAGWSTTKQIVCSQSELRLELISTLSSTESVYELAWLRAIWFQGNWTTNERTAIIKSLLELSLSSGDVARFFPNEKKLPRESEFESRGDNAWLLLQEITSGKKVEPPGKAMLCAD